MAFVDPVDPVCSVVRVSANYELDQEPELQVSAHPKPQAAACTSVVSSATTAMSALR
jgi:hypothetical protein